MKILMMPDSFKGTMSASAAAEAMARGAYQVFPEAAVIKIPLADGGEGTLAALVGATGGRKISYSVSGPDGKPVSAEIGLLGPVYDRAIVEMAQAAGLGLIAPEERDPRTTTTFGVGQLMQRASEKGVATLLVGLGGSATNDGGAGAMTALGARFLNRRGLPLPPGGAALSRLHAIDMTAFRFPRGSVKVIALSDVTNPLTGPMGASAVYGPQKGADAFAVAELDAALAHYAEVVRRDLGEDIGSRAGAGAAGGLGAALMAFLGAEMRSGIDAVLDECQWSESARDADLALTGEGKIDSQTLSGKTIFGLLGRCRQLNIPLIAFGGLVEEDAAQQLRQHGIRDVISLVTQSITKEEALRAPERVLEEAVAQTLASQRWGH